MVCKSQKPIKKQNSEINKFLFKNLKKFFRVDKLLFFVKLIYYFDI